MEHGKTLNKAIVEISDFALGTIQVLRHQRGGWV